MTDEVPGVGRFFCSRYVEEKGGILAGNTVPGIGWKHPGVIHHGDGPVGKAWGCSKVMGSNTQLLQLVREKYHEISQEDKWKIWKAIAGWFT